jgi:hypothetical protein
MCTSISHLLLDTKLHIGDLLMDDVSWQVQASHLYYVLALDNHHWFCAIKSPASTVCMLFSMLGMSFHV